MHGHAQWAEVAPLAPLLVLLGEWCMFVVVLGIVTVVGAFVTSILGTLAGLSFHLPFIGNPVASAVHKAEAAVTHAFGIAEGWIDARIGGAWHEMARLVDWTYKEIRSHANLLYTLAALMVGQATVGALRAAISDVRGRTAVNERMLIRTIGRVESAEHRLQHSVTAGVLPRLGRLEREYEHVIDRDIAGLRTRTKAVEKSLEDAWQYVRSHPWTIVTDAVVGAVAVALARLDLGFLRCPSFLRLGKGIGCGGFGALEDLLFGAVTAVAATDLCDVADAAGGVAHAIRPALMELVDIENALVGCHGATRPPALGIGPLSLPPVRDPLPLAA